MKSIGGRREKFKVQSSKFRVQSSEFRVQGLRKVKGCKACLILHRGFSPVIEGIGRIFWLQPLIC
jgi:hypothetical protein